MTGGLLSSRGVWVPKPNGVEGSDLLASKLEAVGV